MGETNAESLAGVKRKRENHSLEARETIKKNNEGITLIALIITILFSYDELIKFSNNKGFLLATI